MGKGEINFLAVDFGTESVRGAVFNEKGEMVYTSAKNTRHFFPNPGGRNSALRSGGSVFCT